jgi:site-specific DNA-cytosine methylase
MLLLLALFSQLTALCALFKNVKGFHGSEALRQFKEVLHLRGYTWMLFILNPMQVAVPNNRRRFYMICELSDRFNGYQDAVFTSVTAAGGVEMEEGGCNPISKYLMKLTEAERAELVIPDKTLAKPWMVRLASLIGLE